MFLILALLLLPAIAQRADNETLCDYYAIQRYGSNTTTNQFKLLQGIFALAFAGGSVLLNASDELTGIFNPGTFGGVPVTLLPWFNGTRATTNLNNMPVAINWLDGGGETVQTKDVFTLFLTGQTSSIQFSNQTNEYRVFNSFLAAFGDMFNCSGPLPIPTFTTLNLAYIHKFMDLDQIDVGYFLNQVVLSAEYFGFSQEDSVYISTVFNGQYNVRCAAPVGTQLYSLCQDPTCPLAIIQDCDAYLPANLGPSGAISSLTGSVTWTQYTPTESVIASSASASASISNPLQTTTPPLQTTASPSQTTTSSPSPSSSSKPLGTSAIAGIAIGSVALASLVGLAVVFMLTRKKKFESRSHKLSTSNPSCIGAHVDPYTGQVARELKGVPVCELQS